MTIRADDAPARRGTSECNACIGDDAGAFYSQQGPQPFHFISDDFRLGDVTQPFPARLPFLLSALLILSMA